MIFNSYIFILVFFPISVMGYQIIKQKKSPLLNSIYISIISLLFYFYAEVFYGYVLIGILLCNLVCYYLLHWFRNADMRKLILAAGIMGNLCWLAYYKYFNFAIESINSIFRLELPFRDSGLPLGISFISFHMIAFLADSYNNNISDFSINNYFAYATFFPKVVSGPIVTYNEMEKGETNRACWDLLAEGLFLFLAGLIKKVIFADTLGHAVDWAYGNLSELNSITMLLVSFLYTLQIYFDFSGYSDMAIGVARMFGYELPVNFNSPYKSTDMADFWDRWHMTLTNFFTRYLYIPLGGNRKGTVRTYINIMIVFLCSGLWHGASWTFVLWGAVHGALLILHRRFGGKLGSVPHILKVLSTFLIINFTWMIFRAGSWLQLKESMAVLFRWEGFTIHSELLQCFDGIGFGILQNEYCILIAAGIFLFVAFLTVFACPNTQEVVERKLFLNRKVTIVLVIGAVMSILSFSNVTTYIYAMF